MGLGLPFLKPWASGLGPGAGAGKAALLVCAEERAERHDPGPGPPHVLPPNRPRAEGLVRRPDALVADLPLRAHWRKLLVVAGAEGFIIAATVLLQGQAEQLGDQDCLVIPNNCSLPGA